MTTASTIRFSQFNTLLNTNPDEIRALLPNTSLDRQTVAGVEFVGQVTFPTGTPFADTEVGGLSAITYDRLRQAYYVLSDDRSQTNPARFYTVAIDLTDGRLDQGDITFKNITTLLDDTGAAFAEGTIDPEGLVLATDGTLYVSSEGDAEQLINPFVNQFALTGEELSQLPIPDKFLPTADDD